MEYVMKRVVLLTAVLMVAIGVASAVEQEKPWFDAKNCIICQQYAAQPGLMDHMRREFHGISTGMFSLTSVDKEYKEAFTAAQGGIREAISQAMTNGGQMPMCGACAKFRDFGMAGIIPEVIHTDEGVAVFYMTKDTAKVRELQQFAIKAQEEIAKVNPKAAGAQTPAK
jgi:hypothetical protein